MTRWLRWSGPSALGRVRVWHLNDSLRERGSRVDRHAGIGRGHLGPGAVPPPRQRPPVRRPADDPGDAQGGDEDGEELDAVNLRVLRRLEEQAPA